MNPLLAEILSSPWLINTERSAAYASVLLSLIKGEQIFEGDSSLARERNRPYILAGSGNQNERFGFTDTNIPAGSVAVIPIRSEILKYDQPCGPRGTQSILSDVKSADQNPGIKSIVLVIDSPGGQVSGTDLLAEAIRNSTTPVVAFIDGLTASAAYWIISGASRIIASSNLDRIGSIGTMMMVEDLQPALEQLGVKFHEVYATLSVDKNADFNQVLDGKYDDYRKNVLDVINAKFLETIRSFRPSVNETALTGKMFFAPQAMELGLIDKIGSFEKAIETAFSLGNSPFEQAQTNESKTIQRMKFKDTWKAIQNFFKLDPSSLETQELTSDQVQQINDQLATVSARNEELETLLAGEKEAHAITLTELEKLRGEDAAGETIAAKEADKCPGEGEEATVYAHDRIADDFCSKQ
ncbi:MAG: S49 family peptidase [Bacteroidales bacterium]|nr:S49 family peptidase [Bacteroidales bacterium]